MLDLWIAGTSKLAAIFACKLYWLLHGSFQGQLLGHHFLHGWCAFLRLVICVFRGKFYMVVMRYVFVPVVCPFKEWYCVIPDSFPNLSSMAASEHVLINHLTLFLYGNSLAPRIENERPPLDSWRLTAWIVHLHTPALKESDIGTHQMMHASDTSWGSVMNAGISSTRQSRGVQEFRNASTYAMAKEIIQKKQLFSTPTATPPCLAHPIQAPAVTAGTHSAIGVAQSASCPQWTCNR